MKINQKTAIKPKLMRLVIIPATKGSHTGIVKIIKIIAAISSKESSKQDHWFLGQDNMKHS